MKKHYFLTNLLTISIIFISLFLPISTPLVLFPKSGFKFIIESNSIKSSSSFSGYIFIPQKFFGSDFLFQSKIPTKSACIPASTANISFSISTIALTKFPNILFAIFFQLYNFNFVFYNFHISPCLLDAFILSSVGGWVENNFVNQWVFCWPLYGESIKSELAASLVIRIGVWSGVNFF